MAGWVDRRRDHGNLIFIDLRDREGLVQVVFNPETAPEQHAVAERLRSEWVVQVGGLVRARPEGAENPKLATGAIEVAAEAVEVLNESRTPPFEVGADTEVDELLRLKHRYVDLRRAPMRDMLALRHRVVKFIRDFLDARGFLEVETPILIKSTPEGARDYIVPSRLYPGKFYALPQSPQQLKQLLMAGGVDKYFQIARCFRDEDPRADRQPEHTQLDLEMSFVEQDDVLNLIEELYTALVKTVYPDKRLLTPFPRLTYADSMADYGTDKPDLRFGLKMADLSDVAGKTEFRVFRSALDGGGIVKGFAAPGCAGYGRGQIDGLVDFVKSRGAAGLVPIALMGEGASLDDLTEADVRSPVTRFLGLDTVKEIARLTGANRGDLILIIAGPAKPTNVALSALRNEMGQRLELPDPDLYAFAFVTDFPLFEWNEDEGRWDAMHHAFSMPTPEHLDLIESDPGRGDRPDLRPDLQRLRARQRQHPRAPPRATGAHPEGARVHARPCAGAVRPAADRLRVRRAPARRHRARHRPAAHDPDRQPQHPRHDRLPQDAERHRPPVRGPRRGRAGTARRAPHPRRRRRLTGTSGQASLIYVEGEAPALWRLLEVEDRLRKLLGEHLVDEQ